LELGAQHSDEFQFIKFNYLTIRQFVNYLIPSINILIAMLDIC